MKRLSVLFAASLLAATCGVQALAQPAGNFGSPPSGQIPILFNDHHVYTKPDTLKQGRVLAALVRGGTVLIPLRSMFEQMGVTVSYDPASKTVTVTKPGSEVKVTVGKPEVIINGESRPLDVPPIIYQGSVLVPVRVISEGMGAYVQWVPEKQLVVVRYLPPTPPPPPPTAAPPPPTAAPTMAPPTPAPVAAPYKDIFIAGDYIFSPKVYNEFSAGNSGGNSGSYSVRGAYEFDLGNMPWMVAGNFEQFSYNHNCTSGVAAVPPSADCFVTVIGGNGATAVPAFNAKEYDFDGRLGLRVFQPRVYVGVGYMWRTTNYGYPQMNGWGFGVEKLPDLDQPFSVYGSAWYYPNNKGTYAPTGQVLSYNMLKYQLGGTVAFGKSPVFLDLGWTGLRGTNKTNAPVDISINGPYLGLGIKF